MALAILDDVGFGAVTNKWLKNIAEHEGIPFNDTIENDIGLRVVLKEHIQDTHKTSHAQFFKRWSAIPR